MVPFFRLFLVISLILLQAVAPLVHAHVGGDSVKTGLHLHEFEQVMTVAKQALPSYTQDHQLEDSSHVVVVESAIKLKWDDRRMDAWMDTASFPVPILPSSRVQLVLSPQVTARFVASLDFHSHLTRAPPVTL
jgi:hypothetical protein